MAEGWAKTLGKDKIDVNSCGLEASRVHPTAIQVMQEIGIDITDQTSNSISEFKPEDYDAVISLCGCGVNLPQDWLLQEIFQDWQLDDPDGQPLATFRRVRDEIRERIENLITQLS
jgi:arsenate reductase